VGGQAHRLAGGVLAHAGDFVYDAPGLDDGDPALGRALAGPHARLGRLLRVRLVGEDVDPDLSAALDPSRHRDPRSLDLAVGHPAGLEGFEAEVAEVDLLLALGLAVTNSYILHK